MKRITRREIRYANEALRNEFRTSRNNVFNSRFEAQFARTFGVPYAIGHVNGTATLHTALVALDVRPGDEVIVPPLTMSSTALAVLHSGAIPVFADVDPETFNINSASVAACVTRKTRAVISVSLYGLTPDYAPLLKVCKRHRLALIEDNAQCFLGKYNGGLAGQFGDFASFSFQSSKQLTCGEGGVLLTKDPLLADRARKFSSLGYAGIGAKKGKISREDIQDPRYNRHVSLGFNYRMSEVTAAVALGQTERIRELVSQRIKASRYFDKAIEETDCLKKQKTPAGFVNVYWAYAMVLRSVRPSVDWYRFRDMFAKNGGDGFYAAWKLSYEEPYFRKSVQKLKGVWQRYRKGLCPNAEYLQPRLIQLKTNYWELTEAKAQAAILKKTIGMYRGTC